jgi:hypothetical protein
MFGATLKALETVGIRKEDVTFVSIRYGGQPERMMTVRWKRTVATILAAPNTYAAEKQGLRRFSIIRDLVIRQLPR